MELGLGLNQESFSQTPISEMKYIQSLPYPETHNESFSSVKFFTACQKFMKVCGNTDPYTGVGSFSFSDLASPSPKRFKRQLSAAINFIKFREDRLAIYVELHEQREELLQGLQEVKTEQRSLEEELTKVQVDAHARLDQVQELDEEGLELQNEIAQKNKVQKALRGESEKLKKQVKALEDDIEQSDLVLQELDIEERKLMPQIVDSPEELKVQISELNVELEQEKRRLAQAEDDKKLAKLKIANVETAKKDVKEGIQVMQDLSTERAKYQEISKEVEEIEQEISDNQDKVKALEEEYAEHQRELESIGKYKRNMVHEVQTFFTYFVNLTLFYLFSIEQKVQQNASQYKTKLDTLQNALREVNANLLEKEKQNRDVKLMLENEKSDISVLEAIIKEEQTKSENEINEIVDKFHVMEKGILERQEQFNATITV